MTGLLDTSIVLGPADDALPDQAAISVVTLAEMRLGVLVARTAADRAARLERLVEIERVFAAIPVDDEVAASYATIVAAERERGRRPRAMDALIAATALAKGMTLFTRDRELANLTTVKVRLVR